MPRFFFHLHTESGIEPDFLGLSFQLSKKQFPTLNKPGTNT